MPQLYNSGSITDTTYVENVYGPADGDRVNGATLATPLIQLAKRSASNKFRLDRAENPVYNSVKVANYLEGANYDLRDAVADVLQNQDVKHLTLPPGEWLWDGTLFDTGGYYGCLRSNLTFDGVDANNCVLKWTSASVGNKFFSWSSGSVITENITFKNISFDARDSEAIFGQFLFGIDIKNVTIKNCKFFGNYRKDDTQYRYSISGMRGSDVVFADNYQSSSQFGFGYNAVSGSHRLRYQNNLTENCLDYAMSCVSGDFENDIITDIIITDNVISGVRGGGAIYAGSDAATGDSPDLKNLVIANNHIFGDVTNQIEAAVNRNYIKVLQGSGSHFNNIYIHDNVVNLNILHTSSVMNGLVVRAVEEEDMITKGVHIYNNKISLTTNTTSSFSVSDGIVVDLIDADDVIIRNNFVSGTRGIKIGNTRNCLIDGNIIRDCEINNFIDTRQSRPFTQSIVLRDNDFKAKNNPLVTVGMIRMEGDDGCIKFNFFGNEMSGSTTNMFQNLLTASGTFQLNQYNFNSSSAVLNATTSSAGLGNSGPNQAFVPSAHFPD